MPKFCRQRFILLIYPTVAYVRVTNLGPRPEKRTDPIDPIEQEKAGK